MSAESFVSDLLKSFSQVVQPLIDAVTPLSANPPSTDALEALLADFGWTLPAGADAAAIEAAFGTLAGDMTTLVTDAQQLASASSSDEIAAVVADLAKTVGDIANLAAAGSNLNFAPFDEQGFWNGPQSFPVQLWPYLVHRYLRDHVSILYGTLRFLGILTETPQQPVAASGRNAYVEKRIDWGRIPKYASDPGGTFASVYHWGDSTTPLDHASLIQGMGAVAGAFPIASTVDVPSTGVQTLFYPGAVPPNLLQLSASPVPPFDISAPVEVFLKLVFGVIPIPVVGGAPADPVGLALFPLLTGQAAANFKITDLFSVAIEGDFQSVPIIVEFRPALGGGVDATVNQVTLTALANQTLINGKVTLTAAAPSGSTWILVGDASSSHVELAGAHLAIGAAGPVSALDYKVEAGFNGAKIVVDLSDSDGFLQNAMGSSPQSLDLSCTVNWSKKTGFSFNGQAQLSTIIPIHETFASVLELDSVYVAVSAGSAANSAALVVAVSGGVTLGPISATVEKIGVRLEFKQDASGKGNLGDLDLQFGFQPPSGLGLDIEASAVSGGGFISFDNDKGEYAGELELSIEMLQLKAFGLLDTKPEVSFVIIISADFPPIELGFGFALTGVGGLLGVHRTLAVDPLRAAFRAHTIDGTLFLKDPASQGAQVAQNVAAIFPAMHGHFVFGPMVQISWGEPILVSAEIGIIITLPDPIILVILGAIVAAVPDPDEWIILINLDVMGILDFDARTISIDASLYDSYILAYTLSGDMAFRMNYGENPSFALSVGGLHPRFQPPPGFPSLKRMTLSLGDGSNPRLSVAGYFAITANSLQFGAAIDLYAEAGGFGVQGNMSFDVLIVFNPFAFTIDLHASVDLMSGSSVLMSIHLDGTLSGPAPWHLQGSASVSVLFFSVSVNVNATFGQSGPNQSVPTVTVIDKFAAALSDSRNWKAELPADAGRVATLASIPASKDLIIVHPIGQLTFRQTIVPLDVPFTKFGNATPSDAVQFSVTGPVLNGKSTPLNAGNTVRDEFADGQFFSMSDQDKLSKPSFTPHDSGATFGLGALTPSLPEVTEPVQYITIVRDDVMNPTRPGKNYTMLHDTAMALAGHGASALSPRRRSGTQKYVTTGLVSGVTSTSVLYVVVSTGDLSLRADISPSTGDGYTNVQARLAAFLSGNPSAKNSLQIVPLHELPSGAGS